jgi:hypothetical protein
MRQSSGPRSEPGRHGRPRRTVAIPPGRAVERVEDLLALMTLEEKVAQLGLPGS